MAESGKQFFIASHKWSAALKDTSCSTMKAVSFISAAFTASLLLLLTSTLVNASEIVFDDEGADNFLCFMLSSCNFIGVICEEISRPQMLHIALKALFFDGCNQEYCLSHSLLYFCSHLWFILDKPLPRGFSPVSFLFPLSDNMFVNELQSCLTRLTMRGGNKTRSGTVECGRQRHTGYPQHSDQ